MGVFLRGGELGFLGGIPENFGFAATLFFCDTNLSLLSAYGILDVVY